MALDYFAISSQGVYPTPVPSMARRMALAVSQGLLNIVLPTTETRTGFFAMVIGRIKGIILSKNIYL